MILKRSSRSGLDPEADLAASHVASDGLIVLAQNASHFVAAFTVFFQSHYCNEKMVNRPVFCGSPLFNLFFIIFSRIKLHALNPSG